MSAKDRRTDPQRCRLCGDVRNTVIIILSSFIYSIIK